MTSQHPSRIILPAFSFHSLSCVEQKNLASSDADLSPVFRELAWVLPLVVPPELALGYCLSWQYSPGPFPMGEWWKPGNWVLPVKIEQNLLQRFEEGLSGLLYPQHCIAFKNISSSEWIAALFSSTVYSSWNLNTSDRASITTLVVARKSWEMLQEKGSWLQFFLAPLATRQF